MDDGEEQVECRAGAGVLDRPWTAREGEGRVEGDAEEHRERAQGVEVVAAGGEGRRRHGVVTQRWCLAESSPRGRGKRGRGAGLGDGD